MLEEEKEENKYHQPTQVKSFKVSNLQRQKTLSFIEAFDQINCSSKTQVQVKGRLMKAIFQTVHLHHRVHLVFIIMLKIETFFRLLI